MFHTAAGYEMIRESTFSSDFKIAVYRQNGESFSSGLKLPKRQNGE